MEPTYLDPGGVPVDAQALIIPCARMIMDAILTDVLDYVRFVECRCRAAESNNGKTEIIVVDLDIQRPQSTIHDIRRVERVAIAIQNDDDTYPEVLALRGDFPLVPHLNLRKEEFPRSLCLYDQSWLEVRTRWTASAFIERIRDWFAATATGTLHRDDQPLEPLLFGTSYRLVIPTDAVNFNGESAVKLEVELVRSGDHQGTFIARKAQSVHPNGQPPKFIASTFIADSRQHGIISRSPRNLSELCDFVKGETFDLLGALRKRLILWKDEGCLDSLLIIVIAFPLRRHAASDVEISDIWTFLTPLSVFELGKRIGIWDRTDKNKPPGVLIIPDESRRGTDVELDVVRPHFSFSRVGAAKASGLEPVLCRTVAVGAGALGSQVILNLVKSGFGKWTVIDEDELMPHNLARHALPPWCVGMTKAMAIGRMIDAFYEEDSPTGTIAANLLRPGNQKQEIGAAFAAADLIIDFAASVSVARYIGRQVESTARRVSLFLNPCGSDLVCIREDKERRVSLDCLEMQYYRALIRDECLAGHLKENTGKMRYARSCRDVSFSLPTHLVSLHAAIGTHAIRLAVRNEDASITVWRCDPLTCTVAPVDVPVHQVHRAKVGDWTLIMDDWLFHQLSGLRSAKLPNETGGVLIGSYDLPSKTIYVVDTVASPPDSEEWPTLYIRGSEGLRTRVAEISALTAGQLEYVGEWHSHPDRCSCMPSKDDVKVFAWMTEGMSVAGLPALMAIVGEGNSSCWFLGAMEDNEGWKPEARAISV